MYRWAGQAGVSWARVDERAAVAGKLIKVEEVHSSGSISHRLDHRLMSTHLHSEGGPSQKNKSAPQLEIVQ